MKQLLTVLLFEYKTYVKSKSFIIMTLIMVLAAVVVPAIPAIGNLFGSSGISLGGDSADQKIALTDMTGHFTADLCEKYLPGPVVVYSDAEQASKAVTEGTCKFALALTDFNNFTFYIPAMELSYYSLLNQIREMIKTEYTLVKLQDAGYDASEAADLLAFSPNSQIVSVATSSGGGAGASGDNADNYRENLVYAYVMIFVLYFSLIMYGQYVLVSVVREKSTKTMELLVTSCKSIWLINGKVLGVGLAGLTQLGLLVLAAFVSMRLGNRMPGMEGFIISIKPDILVFMLLFFVLGFFMLAYIYAGLASTVSRMEDASSASMLPMFMILIGFLASMMGMMTPSAVWVTVLSYIPFTTPMVMFMRVCLGVAAAWEAWLSIVILLLSTGVISVLAAKIYRMGTLMYGIKPNMKDIVKLLFS